VNATVSLSWPELVVGAHAGCMRRVRKLSRGEGQGRHGRQAGEPWGRDVEAACAEMAAAKALGRYWADGAGEGDTPDVGVYHVRHTHRADGSLILHREDPAHALFVLVLGTAPTFTLAGWLRAGDGQQPCYWTTYTGRPCYMVPQADLHGMESLP